MTSMLKFVAQKLSGLSCNSLAQAETGGWSRIAFVSFSASASSDRAPRVPSIHFPARRTETGQRISDLSEAQAAAYYASLNPSSTPSHDATPAATASALEPVSSPAARQSSSMADLSPNSIVFPDDQFQFQERAVNPMSAGPKGQAKYVQISPGQRFLSAAEIESIELGGASP